MKYKCLRSSHPSTGIRNVATVLSHQLHIYYSLNICSGPADDGCNTIASHLSPGPSLADSRLLLRSRQIQLFHLKSLRPSMRPTKLLRNKIYVCKITELLL